MGGESTVSGDGGARTPRRLGSELLETNKHRKRQALRRRCVAQMSGARISPTCPAGPRRLIPFDNGDETTLGGSAHHKLRGDSHPHKGRRKPDKHENQYVTAP
jgi:hypothetical protein